MKPCKHTVLCIFDIFYSFRKYFLSILFQPE